MWHGTGREAREALGAIPVLGREDPLVARKLRLTRRAVRAQRRQRRRLRSTHPSRVIPRARRTRAPPASGWVRGVGGGGGLLGKDRHRRAVPGAVGRARRASRLL